MLNRPFRLLGLVFLAGAGLLVVLGIWTFTFSATRGELVELKDTGLMMSGRYDGVPFVHGRPNRTGSLAVEYRYLAEGQRIKGTRIGMGLAPWTLSPFGPMRWERYARTGAELTVYDAPSLPGISVLHKGHRRGQHRDPGRRWNLAAEVFGVAGSPPALELRLGSLTRDNRVFGRGPCRSDRDLCEMVA